MLHTEKTAQALVTMQSSVRRLALVMADREPDVSQVCWLAATIAESALTIGDAAVEQRDVPAVR